MSIPTPASVYGLNTTETSSGNRFFDTLFRIYNAFSPRSTRGFAAQELNPIADMKSSESEFQQGLNIEVTRYVSKYMQVSHNFLLSSDSDFPPYINMVQFNSEPKQIASHLWGSYALASQFYPSMGNVMAHVVGSFYLTKEANEPLSANPKGLTFNLGIRSTGDLAKLDETPFIDSLNVKMDMASGALSFMTNFRDNFQVTMKQRITDGQKAQLTYFVVPANGLSGMNFNYRFETKGSKLFPRDTFFVSATGNSLMQLVNMEFAYARMFSKNLKWCSNLDFSNDLTSSTGIQYKFRHHNFEASAVCMLSSKGILTTKWVHPIMPEVTFDLGAQADVMNSKFAFGLGLKLAM